MKILFETNPDSTVAQLFDIVGERIDAALGEAISRGGKWEFELKRPTRTLRQNNSLYLFIKWVTKSLNGSGNLLHLEYFGKHFEIKWTDESVKDRIWNPIQKALTNKTSSAHLTTAELTQIAEQIQNNLSKHLGIIISFPSELVRQLGIKPFEITKPK